MPTKNTKREKTRKVKGYGVFVKDYGGLIGFSNEERMATKLAKTEYAEVSFSRSESEFKVKPITISYSFPLPPKRKGK